ncbi:hypothetical protein B0T17DRAFT_568158 [Bombardia bombarda]|uniref:BRCT domain-containing protein n=1 Tax=Bombardia bombarda TaxID=252184 RepID=A0AA39XPP4_9PEZI|nr:hypothetical protein B0T17DRAFT_568158 [Bombardia bombarda]
MATLPKSLNGDSEDENALFDAAHPFKGIVVCCTSIPPELRSDIAAKTHELGGIHKYDLTPDCTHLIVGEYDTPKYRHVAKERPDVKPMAAGWIEAVRDLWVADRDIDFAALEAQWQLRTFETSGGDDNSLDDRPRLLCCLTGFEDPDERQHIVSTIEANGGNYTGDLTRRVTHLIVYKPEGRKYQAAKNWGIHTVAVEWVHHSVERGMILDEKCYDPILPPDERGVGAWNVRRVTLGKRLRETAAAAHNEGRRKLRKTASMKLNSQRDHLWGDILGKPQTADPTVPVIAESFGARPTDSNNTQQQQLQQLQQLQQQQSGAGNNSADTQGTRLSSFGAPDDSVIFASCCFYAHGFPKKKNEVLLNAVASLGGLVYRSLDEVASTSGAQLAHRFLIVPQDSRREAHPLLPNNVNIITEFYIERCMFKKFFFDPSEHVIGRPFPSFPIPGFESLSVSTAGFTDIDLNQVNKAILQLGAKYEERFTAEISLLICPSLSAVRKQKLDLALAWKVPIVSAGWLWDCISTGCNVPIREFLFPELKQKISSAPGKEKEKAKAKPLLVDKDLLSKPAPTGKPNRARGHYRLDASMFDSPSTEKDNDKASKPAKETDVGQHPPQLEEQESHATSHFETAPTHQLHTSSSNSQTSSLGKNNSKGNSAPLSEASSNALNKTFRSSTPKPHKPPQSQQPQPANNTNKPPRKPISRIASEVADSEATDGEICTPSDADEGSETSPPEEAARKAKESEEAKRKKCAAQEKEAERLALETRLASLLDVSRTTTTTTTTTADGADATASAPAAAAGGAGTDGEHEDGKADKRRRRKREILGRAISNVSAASNGSADSASAVAAAAAAPSGGRRTMTKTASVAAALQPPPPGTQLEYQDPEAKRYKVQLMNKMLGMNGSGGGGGMMGGRMMVVEKEVEKLTLEGLGGYKSAVQKQQLGGYAGGEEKGEGRGGLHGGGEVGRW